MKIHLTEEQYIYIISKELNNFNSLLLNESILDKKRILDLIYNGCNSYEDKKRRLIKLYSVGALTATMVLTIFLSINPNTSKQEVQEFKQELIDNTPKEQVYSDNRIYANSITISEDGINHIKSYEKLRLEPYCATQKERNDRKVTIGWGHVINEKDPQWLQDIANNYLDHGIKTKISESQANQIFIQDIKTSEKYIKSLVISNMNPNLQKPGTIPQSLVDVMISMMFNGGYGNFKNVKLNPFYQKILNCRFDKNTGKIDKSDYNYAITFIPNSLILQGGEVVKGLVNRRQEEYNIVKNK